MKIFSMKSLLVLSAASLSLLAVGCDNVGDKNEEKIQRRKLKRKLKQQQPLTIAAIKIQRNNARRIYEIF